MQLITLFLELRIFFFSFSWGTFPLPKPQSAHSVFCRLVSRSRPVLCLPWAPPLASLQAVQEGQPETLGNRRDGVLSTCSQHLKWFFSGEGTVFVYPNLDLGRAGCWNPPKKIYLLLLILGDGLPTPFLLHLLLTTGVSASCFRREHRGGPSSAGLLSCSQLHVCRGFWIWLVFIWKPNAAPTSAKEVHHLPAHRGDPHPCEPGSGVFRVPSWNARF